MVATNSSDSPGRPVVYEGETLIANFDPESVDELEALEARLEEFIDLEEGEQLHVSLVDGQLTVKKLREL